MSLGTFRSGRQPAPLFGNNQTLAWSTTSSKTTSPSKREEVVLRDWTAVNKRRASCGIEPVATNWRQRPQRAERPGDVSHADASYGTSRCLFSTRHIGDRGPRESIQIDRAASSVQAA